MQIAGAAPVAEVVANLTTLDGLASWWTPDVSGSPAPGGELTFRFRGGPPTVMRVEHVDPAGLVVWTCAACGAFADWVGTSLWFTVRPRPGGGSVLAFRQVGLTPDVECFAVCTPRWEHHLANLVGGRDRVDVG